MLNMLSIPADDAGSTGSVLSDRLSVSIPDPHSDQQFRAPYDGHYQGPKACEDEAGGGRRQSIGSGYVGPGIVFIDSRRFFRDLLRCSRTCEKPIDKGSVLQGESCGNEQSFRRNSRQHDLRAENRESD